VKELIATAQEAYARVDYHQVMKLARRALEQEHWNPTAAYLLGAAACNVKDVGAAREALAHLVERDKKKLVKICRDHRVSLAPGSAAAPSVKRTLSRADIMSGMKGVAGQVRACGELHGLSERVSVSVTISPEGRVTAARLVGRLARTPAGDCIGLAVRGAHFPSFVGAPVTIDLPFKLR
jgi:hypothetical protein